MAIQGVKNAIARASQDPIKHAVISKAEAKEIVQAAESDGTVAKGEADLVAKLVSFQGDGRNLPKVNAGAAEVFNAFFGRHNLPLGGNAGAVKAKMEAALATLDTAPLAQAPSLRGTYRVQLRDQRPVDGPLQEAFLDAAKGQFFVKSTPARMLPGAEPRWSGPFSLDAAGPTPPPGGSTATTQQIVDRLKAATADMSYPSESDYPFETRVFPGAGKEGGIKGGDLRALLGLPPGTKVEVRSFAALLERLSPQDWMDPDQQVSAQKFVALRAAMEGDLKDLQVIRTGRIQVGVHLVGRTPSNDLVAVSSVSIET